jgi:hypothetical protein
VRYWEAMYLRADPLEDSEAELALLRDARLAAIPFDWGHYARRCQWQRATPTT